jgi:hypothetical protein
VNLMTLIRILDGAFRDAGSCSAAKPDYMKRSEAETNIESVAGGRFAQSYRRYLG